MMLPLTHYQDRTSRRPTTSIPSSSGLPLACRTTVGNRSPGATPIRSYWWEPLLRPSATPRMRSVVRLSIRAYVTVGTYRNDESYWSVPNVPEAAGENSRGSMACDWRRLCPTVDCYRLMMIMIKLFLIATTWGSLRQGVPNRSLIFRQLCLSKRASPLIKLSFPIRWDGAGGQTGDYKNPYPI